MTYALAILAAMAFALGTVLQQKGGGDGIRTQRPLHCESGDPGILTRMFSKTLLVAVFQSPQAPSESLPFPLDKDT